MDHKGVFARKPVADIIEVEDGAFKSLPKVLGAFSITAVGVGAIRHHRRRDLRAHRHRGGAVCGARAHDLLCARGHRLWLGRPLLCRAFDAAAGAGLDLYLHLRDAGRTGRLDDRLGPDPRIFHGRGRRRLRLVGLFQQPAGPDRHGAADRALVGDRRADRAGRRIARRRHRPCACGRHRDDHHRSLDRRHARIGEAQQCHGRGEADRRLGLRGGRRGLRQHGELASLHPAQHRRVRGVRNQRHPARRLDRVLRLYRLRRRLELRPGSMPAAARHADRHPRFRWRCRPCSTSPLSPC